MLTIPETLFIATPMKNAHHLPPGESAGVILSVNVLFSQMTLACVRLRTM